MIGEIIKIARQAQDMTTHELATKAKITQPMLSRYETGKVIPTHRVLKRLGKALKMDFIEVNEAAHPAPEFDQRKFDNVMAKAKSLSVADKKVILAVVDAFLKIRDTQILFSASSDKKG